MPSTGLVKKGRNPVLMKPSAPNVGRVLVLVITGFHIVMTMRDRSRSMMWLNWGTVLEVLAIGAGVVIMVAFIAGCLMSRNNWRPK